MIPTNTVQWLYRIFNWNVVVLHPYSMMSRTFFYSTRKSVDLLYSSQIKLISFTISILRCVSRCSPTSQMLPWKSLSKYMRFRPVRWWSMRSFIVSSHFTTYWSLLCVNLVTGCVPILCCFMDFDLLIHLHLSYCLLSHTGPNSSPCLFFCCSLTIVIISSTFFDVPNNCPFFSRVCSFNPYSTFSNLFAISFVYFVASFKLIACCYIFAVF